MSQGIVNIPLPSAAHEADDARAGGRANAAALNGFLIGPENGLVEIVFQAVLSNQPEPYNPIVLYGPSGVGKTHLARGLVDAWREQHRRGALYETAVDFARKLNNAIETHGIEEFHNRYRSAALLVMEDLGELRARPVAQEELLHTLDAQLACGHRVVLTSAVAPAETAEFLPGLRSRLGAGLVVRLEPPGPAAREAIVRRAIAVRTFHFSEPAVGALVARLTGVAAELIGAAVRLGMAAEVERREVSADDVQQYVDSLLREKCPRLRDIATATARHFSLKIALLRSASRRQAVAQARGVAMYLARQLTRESLEQIGKYFGGRDHTTVLHACRKTAERLDADPAIHRAVQQLQQELGQPLCKT